MSVEQQITRNCHFISRFLTTPWEDGKRQLHFYDFDKDAFGKMSSRNMFAEKELNSQVVEHWLRDILETPLGAVRPRLIARDPNALTDWRFYRAAILMLWLQGLRLASVDEKDSRLELERLAAEPTTRTDAFVMLTQQEYDRNRCTDRT